MDVKTQSSAEYKRRICLAVDFINEHLADNPPVAEIARAAHFSSFHFQRLFRAILGESVGQFTRRVRLETAARKLASPAGDDITALAIGLGFSSSQNFAKAFKKQFGVSPTEYRDRIRSEEMSTIGNASGYGAGYDRAENIPLIPGRSTNIDVMVKDLPAVRVAYQRHFGSYDDPGVHAAFDDLVRWAGPRGLDVFERYLGIPWDDKDVTADDKCRFDACLIVPDDFRLDRSINLQVIPAGRYAVYSCDVVRHDFDTPWTELMRDWLPHSGYQPADAPRFEVYRTDGRYDPDGRWQIDVCLPVAPL